MYASNTLGYWKSNLKSKLSVQCEDAENPALVRRDQNNAPSNKKRTRETATRKLSLVGKSRVSHDPTLTPQFIILLIEK